ncbi:hypothetical protein GCM10007383_04710 [Arenibacter certesii]|uniref:DUF1343 domain-containing protein n=2 Tax=Arenibacter certesii TaxID=228955 RepID=A0A918INM7_9FLAO|nr:hypothetical protein GCM10007383_04710 [Arenibacter certesii]
METDSPIIVGANRTEKYLPLLKGKKVAVVANQTSVVFKDPEHLTYTHIVDSLRSLDIDLQLVFAPEHGFRGEADAGEKVTDGKDEKTGLPLISLYGSNRKPSKEQLKGVDVVLFDIQDVGVRFYTYIATMQLVMEACAAENIPVIVLDRPNPNGHYVDGPSMETEHRGFLGMTNIPLVYGMTIGEYANMINKEGMMENKVMADLTVIPLENYDHFKDYILPIRPSPNLPNNTSIYLYPSLGFFEGTNINAGRGTEFQFQRYGAPFLDSTQYSFKYTPNPNFGSKSPKHKGKVCYGKDLSQMPKMKSVDLNFLLDAYQNSTDKELFFLTSGFTRHAGTEKLQKQIEAGLLQDEIKATWQEDINHFKKIREKHLLYN